MNDFKAFLSGERRQWLMGFAILWVIAFHFCMYGNLLHVEALNFLFGKGYLGVDIFIFLSCYGLCHSYEKRILKDFYVQRLRRLFPMYLVFVVVLVTAFAALMPYTPVVTGLLQLTGLANFFGIEVEWYIPSLILIYALFPLIFTGIEYLYKKNIWWILSLVLVLVAASPILSKGIFYLFVIRFPLVVIAAASFFAVRDNAMDKIIQLFVFSALVGFCFSGREMLNGSQTGMLLLPLIFLGLSQLRLSLPLTRAISFLGRHTLEIYLAQNLALNQFYAASSLHFPIKTAIAFFVIIAISCLLWSIQWLFYIPSWWTKE